MRRKAAAQYWHVASDVGNATVCGNLKSRTAKSVGIEPDPVKDAILRLDSCEASGSIVCTSLEAVCEEEDETASNSAGAGWLFTPVCD